MSYLGPPPTQAIPAWSCDLLFFHFLNVFLMIGNNLIYIHPDKMNISKIIIIE